MFLPVVSPVTTTVRYVLHCQGQLFQSALVAIGGSFVVGRGACAYASLHDFEKKDMYNSRSTLNGSLRVSKLVDRLLENHWEALLN